MWQKVAKFKGAEYFRKALYIRCLHHHEPSEYSSPPSQGKASQALHTLGLHPTWQSAPTR